MPARSQFLLYLHKHSNIFMFHNWRPMGQGKKFDFLGVSLYGKLFVNFDSVYSEGYIVHYQIFDQI